VSGRKKERKRRARGVWKRKRGGGPHTKGEVLWAYKKNEDGGEIVARQSAKTKEVMVFKG